MNDPSSPENMHPDEHQSHPNDMLYEQIMRARESLGYVDPSRREVMERNQAAMEHVAIPLHEFEGLSQEERNNIFEELVGEIFDQDETAQRNLGLIKEAREKRDEERIKKLTVSQKSHYDELRRQVAFTLGFEIEDTAKEDQEYRARLLDRVAGMGDADPEDVMKSLGFLTYDKKEDAYRFTMPQDVFPPHIVEQWERYTKSIQDHTRASMKFDRAIDDNAGEIVQLDAIRRYAHNNLANSVKEFLKLEDWDFERCRVFIKKMVEKRFPTIETSESAVTSADVINRLRTIDALGVVVERHHPHAS